ncbi:FAD-dependent oxidoreductase [Alicyclobacillus fodiniaquatilis]|jgi:putative polyketide hydroxylase|uniref:FAD-dependent oxidoreductase n=1 Tax=Alicyclobacillus fodiniaquatilis TaxID=1661150 RepID=A0ABW4JPN5_9BACL
MTSKHVPILIVGGGLVGLSAALFLSEHQIPYQLIERHAGTSIHPRARGVNHRTMELFRTLGFDDRIRDAEFLKKGGIFTAETLKSVDFTQRPSAAFQALRQEMEALKRKSPAMRSWITQDVLEPILLSEAEKRGGGHFCFSTELVSLAQDDAGVTVTVRDRTDASEQTIRADYVIACDGAKSPIRLQLGIDMTGRKSLGHVINVYFRSALTSLLDGHEFSICNITHPDAPGSLLSINATDRWTFHTPYNPGAGETPAQFTPERCAEMIRTAVGSSDIDIEILSILPWEPAMGVTDQFQVGRIFLAGDAAHVMPPTGGYGGNTGIQDVHNLAWKLALVYRGEAAPSILATYETERWPLARLTVEQAGHIANSGVFSVVQGKGPIVKQTDIVLGFRYHSSAIVHRADVAQDDADLNGQPGTRAPHVWLTQQGKQISTLDLFNRHFVLLASEEDAHWREAAAVVSDRLGVSIIAYTIGQAKGDLIDVDDHWRETYGIQLTEAVLVRPDGVVAWRAKETTRAEQALANTMMKILGR